MALKHQRGVPTSLMSLLNSHQVFPTQSYSCFLIIKIINTNIYIIRFNIFIAAKEIYICKLRLGIIIIYIISLSRSDASIFFLMKSSNVLSPMEATIVVFVSGNNLNICFSKNHIQA